MNNTNNHLEIERKYLVKDDSYKQLATQQIPILQGYLHTGDNCSVRIRRWADTAYLTIKSHVGAGELARYEIEKEVSVEEAIILLGMCISGKIEKTRWIVPMADGLVCEVDEFFGDNAGLVMAEVELSDKDQAFDKPAFLGEEVTNDGRYYNSYLSRHPYITW